MEYLYRMKRALIEKWESDEGYQKWLDDQWKEEWEKRIRESLPKLLEGNAMVWCRNGSVVHMAAPCNTLLCKYKSSKEDVLEGVIKCGLFQITTKSSTWDDAVHICASCDVTPFTGW